jgi:hypothetical protein
MVAGSVPSVNLGALAAFLLTGQSSREVKDRTPEGPRPAAPVAAATLTPLSPPPPPPPKLAPAARAEPAASAAPAATPTPTTAPGQGALAASPSLAAPPAAAAPLLSVPTALSGAVGVEALPAAADPAPAVSRGAPRAWLRPAAIGAGVVALGFGALAIQQGVTASQTYSDANAMVGAGGVLLPGSDPSQFQELQAHGDAAQRNAYIAAGTAVVFAATAGVLGWMSRDGRPAEPVIRF